MRQKTKKENHLTRGDVLTPKISRLCCSYTLKVNKQPPSAPLQNPFLCSSGAVGGLGAAQMRTNLRVTTIVSCGGCRACVVRRSVWPLRPAPIGAAGGAIGWEEYAPPPPPFPTVCIARSAWYNRAGEADARARTETGAGRDGVMSSGQTDCGRRSEERASALSQTLVRSLRTIWF